MLDQVDKIQARTDARSVDDTRRRPQPEEGPLDILFEDDSVIVLDKPAGVVVHPTYKNTSGTLLNAVLWRVRDRAGAQPGILTRLDKNTSGVVVIALTAELHRQMQRDMIAGRVQKEYLAVVAGCPDPRQGRIRLPLGRADEDRRRVVVRDDGAMSETMYEVVQAGERSIVRCELITGRTHQIRVHLASSGWPLLGDSVYGTPDALLTRQALHAWRVRFPHPVTGERMTVVAPPPADLRPFLQNFTL